MKAVIESPHSHLGRLSENGKTSDDQKGALALDDGFGGDGFPLLINRSKALKKGNQQAKKLLRKGKTGASSRQRRMHERLSKFELNLAPSYGDMSPVEIVYSSALTAARIEMGSRSAVDPQDCFVEMCSSRPLVARWRHAGDQPFDSYSSEYYSCGKKRVQHKGGACNFSNVDCACGMDVSAHSSASDSEFSVSTCAEDNAVPMQVKKLSINLAEKKACIDEGCLCISEATPALSKNDSEGCTVEGMNVDHLHNRGRECADAGSQQESDEEESSWECSLSVLRRKFPPPLNMLALQSYSPEACVASHCLRSFRQDGRIVLQEVQAPTHKYIRVKRENGRLKLEMMNAVEDSGQDDDKTSALDVCMGVKHPRAGLGTEELFTSDTHMENTCAGTLLVSMHSETSKNGKGSGIGCSTVDEWMSGGKANIRELVTPLELVEVAALDIESRLKLESEAFGISSDLVVSAEERMLQGNLMLADKIIGVEGIVSCLNEQASSPTRVETTTVYDGPSARMKHNWVHPISAC